MPQRRPRRWRPAAGPGAAPASPAGLDAREPRPSNASPSWPPRGTHPGWGPPAPLAPRHSLAPTLRHCDATRVRLWPPRPQSLGAIRCYRMYRPGARSLAKKGRRCLYLATPRGRVNTGKSSGYGTAQRPRSTAKGLLAMAGQAGGGAGESVARGEVGFMSRGGRNNPRISRCTAGRQRRRRSGRGAQGARQKARGAGALRASLRGAKTPKAWPGAGHGTQQVLGTGGGRLAAGPQRARRAAADRRRRG